MMILIALQVKEQECEISREAASRVTSLNNPKNEIINRNNHNNLRINLDIPNNQGYEPQPRRLILHQEEQRSSYCSWPRRTA